MPRKITTGVVGGPILGLLKTLDNTISPNTPNEDITIDPTGTGETNIIGHLNITLGSTVKFNDDDGSAYVGLTAPAAVSSDLTFTLPASDGSSGQVIVTNASGTLSFTDINMPVTNDTVSGTTHYPMLTTLTSGNETGIKTSSSKLSFTPSSGTLNTTNATLTGTMQAATITETSSITLKENISPISNALESVMQLAGVIYDRKDGSTTSEAGLIAEDVEKVLPNLVKKDAQGNPESIMYTKLSAYLIEAVKSLKEQVDKLSKEK